MFKPNSINKIIFFTMLLFLSKSFAFDNNATARCHLMRNPFVLNKANVNALVALSCSGLSHVENERKNMTYDDSATMFHQWSTTSAGGTINVEGYCAVPYTDLKAGDLDRHKVSLKFRKINTNSAKMAVAVEGTIAGKSMNLEFGNNQFLDDNCADSEVQIDRLQAVNIGLGLDAVMDILRSKRSSVSLNLLENENWAQGQVSGYFSGIAVQYRMALWGGSQLAIVAAPGATGTELDIRSADYVYYADTSGPKTYFELTKDSFGVATGFADEHLPTNNKFQAYSIDGGSQIVGCSALIFDGELDISSNVDMDNCKRHIEQSALSKYAARKYIAPISNEEVAADNKKIADATLLRKVQIYINTHYPPALNYSTKPGVYETGRAHWTKQDEARGYVVVQRSFEILVNDGIIKVYEHHCDRNGNITVKQISILITGL
jgi:hypothetical protein